MKPFVLAATLMAAVPVAVVADVQETDLLGVWLCTTSERESSTSSRFEVFSDGALTGIVQIVSGTDEKAIVSDLDYQGTWKLQDDILIETLTWLRLKSVTQNDLPVLQPVFEQFEEQFQCMVGLRTSSTILSLDLGYLDLKNRIYGTLSECQRE